MNTPDENEGDKNALTVQLLLAEYDKVWDSIQFWANELNKLIYWKLLLMAAAIAAHSTREIVLLGVCCSAPTFWLLLARRASYYFNLNLNRKSQLESALKNISGHDKVFEHSKTEQPSFSVSFFQSNTVAVVWTTVSTAALLTMFISRLCEAGATPQSALAGTIAALGVVAFFTLVLMKQ